MYDILFYLINNCVRVTIYNRWAILSLFFLRYICWVCFCCCWSFPPCSNSLCCFFSVFLTYSWKTSKVTACGFSSPQPFSIPTFTLSLSLRYHQGSLQIDLVGDCRFTPMNSFLLYLLKEMYAFFSFICGKYLLHSLHVRFEINSSTSEQE